MECCTLATSVQTWKHVAMELWKARCRRVNLAMTPTLEARCRRIDVETWRCGALEAHCRCSNVEAWMRGRIELCSCAELGVWSAGGALQVCRHGGTELRSSEVSPLA